MQEYIDYIVESRSETGWLGPNVSATLLKTAYLGRTNILFSLQSYASGAGDPLTQRAMSEITRDYILAARELLKSTPLGGWAAARSEDMILAAEDLLDSAPPGVLDEQQTAAIFDYMHTVYTQGYRWEDYFASWAGKGPPKSFPNDYAYGHNVNLAQAIKSAGVFFRVTKNSTLADLSLSRMEMIDQKIGLPHGMFVGDENIHLGSRSPSRGIELCGVVEGSKYQRTCFLPPSP